tara:strand:- start:1828 stop:1956 length:129 start_codon:yes stop_codon:yes gene_type:complete
VRVLGEEKYAKRERDFLVLSNVSKVSTEKKNKKKRERERRCI